MSSTSFHTSSSVKNMKSTADAGKRCSSFRARVRRNAQFATMSSCARRFFKHLTSNSDERYDIPKSGEFLPVVNFTCDSVTLIQCTSLTQNLFTDRINVVINAHCDVVRFLKAFLYCQCFSIFLTTYSNQKPSNLCQEIL